MTGNDGKYLPPKAWARERVATKIFDTIIGWFIIGLIGGGLMVISEGFRHKAEDIWNSPTKLQEAVDVGRGNSARLDALSKRVAVLSQPDVVFEVSARNSGPIEGYCVERQPCAMRLRIRRVEAALSCKIVPGASWGFINPRTDSFTAAQRLDTPSGRDLSATWAFVEIVVMTPSGLAPESDFVFEASYTGCPGMDAGDEPITRTSERIPIKILDTPCRYKISASGIIHGPDSPHWSQTGTDRCFATRAAAEAALD